MTNNADEVIKSAAEERERMREEGPGRAGVYRSHAPNDVQACPACGHFFSPAINRFCLVCVGREDISKARAELQVQLNRANALYQEKERALSDLAVMTGRFNNLHAQLGEARNQIDREREKHLEHLGEIIIELAKAKGK